jgi:hypothetical protein
MPLKFELLQADDYSRYLLRGKTDILFNLRGLMQKRAMLSAFIDASADSFLTAIVALTPTNATWCSTRQRRNHQPPRRGRRAADLRHPARQDQDPVCRPRHQRIPRRPRRLPGPVPEVLLRLQRREYFRLTAPSPHSLTCLIPMTIGESARDLVEASVLDISGGGLAITVPPRAWWSSPTWSSPTAA